MKELLETGVSLSLVYDESANALIGRIKDYAVAVRENDATMSYGCLLWAKQGDYAAVTDAEEYLASQVTSKPDVVKHFKVTDRGIAVALVKTGDPFVNVNNIKRFLIDLASSLSVNFYKSCCYDCGATEDLGIYDAGGTLVQACSKCGEKYKLLMKLGEAPAPKAPAMPAPAIPAPAAPAIPEPAAPVIPEPAAPAAAEPHPDMAKEFSALFSEAGDKAAEEAPIPAAETVEQIAEQTVKQAPEQITEQTPADEHNMVFSELLATDKKEEKPASAPFFGRGQGVSDEAAAAEFAALLSDMKPDGGENVTAADIEKQRLEAENKAAENADFAAFMYDAEAEKAKAEAEDPWKDDIRAQKRHETAPAPDNSGFDDFVLSEIERDRVGAGELDLPAQEKEIVGHDENIAVTEYIDDSNIGENIDVEAIESKINAPTDTSGKKLTAKETPLEADGSVPLINPNSGYADIKPSPVSGPDAVEPLESRERIRAVTDESELRVTPVGYATGEDPRADDGLSKRFRSERQVTPTYVSAPSYVPHEVKRISFGSDLLFGIIGALVLGTIGAALWVLLSTMGSSGMSTRSERLIFALGTLAILGGTFGGYRFGGGEMDMKGIVASTIINVILDVAAVVCKYIFSVKAFIADSLGFNMSLADAAQWVTYQFEHPSTLFLFDFWGSIIIMVVGLAAIVVKLVKSL